MRCQGRRKNQHKRQSSAPRLKPPPESWVTYTPWCWPKLQKGGGPLVVSSLLDGGYYSYSWVKAQSAAYAATQKRSG
jgi:hypothetical protein